MSEGQREFTIKKECLGEQTGLGGAEPYGGWEVGLRNPICLSMPPNLLTPTLQPDATCPVHLYTQTVHSFKGYLFSTCLWPGRVPGTVTADSRQTITPVLGEQEFYQGPNVPFLQPPALASSSSAHRPALLKTPACSCGSI